MPASERLWCARGWPVTSEFSGFTHVGSLAKGDPTRSEGRAGWLTFAVMRERVGQWSQWIPDGAGDIAVLLMQLFIALTVIGWAYNRGFRAPERGPLIRLPLLTLSFGLALL